MGDIDLNAEIRNHREVDDAIRDGINRALRETGNWLQRNGRSKARDVIRGADRIWRRKVYYGWSTASGTLSAGQWNGKLRNEAPHAHIVENGVKPGNTPQVQHIIPWVSDELSPHELEGRDPENWDPELQELAAQYSPGYVLTAFAVKDKLEREGYPGIGFMEAAETYMQRVGPMVLRQKAEKQIERELRKHNLK